MLGLAEELILAEVDILLDSEPDSLTDGDKLELILGDIDGL